MDQCCNHKYNDLSEYKAYLHLYNMMEKRFHWTNEDVDILLRQFLHIPKKARKYENYFNWTMLMGDMKDAKIMNERTKIKLHGTAKEVALQFVRSI